MTDERGDMVADVPTKIVIPCDGSGEPYEVPLTPEEEAQSEADRQHHAKQQLGQYQAIAEDQERLRVINERARTDPAYAALADIVLKGMSR